MIKKLIILLGILVYGITSYSQSYIKMLNEENKWNVLVGYSYTCNCGEYRTLSISIDGDTLINDTSYKKLQSIEHSVLGIAASQYIGAIREDSSETKVYFRELNSNTESLIYNFSVEIGDTIDSIQTFNSGGPDYYYTTVSNIDTVVIYNVSRRRISTSGWYDNDQWIEGIGSLKHGPVIFKNWEFLLEFPVVELLCFWESDSLLYKSSNPEYSTCYYVLIIDVPETKSSNKISIFPNPSDGIFTIAINPSTPLRVNDNANLFQSRPLSGVETKITITDITGKTISNLAFQQERLSIDMSDFAKGIYFVRIINNKNKYKQKLVLY